MIRVIHSVKSYLSISENWIYPQVTGVPGIRARVICRSVENLDTFPLKGSKPIVSPPPRGLALGAPRALNAVARRLGLGQDACSEVQVRHWNPQVLHAHFGVRGWESLGLKARLKIPLVTSFYGFDAWMLPKSKPIWMERYRQLFATGELFLVEGPAMRERLIALGCPSAKVRVHRIGVDVTTISSAVRQDSGPLRIVMVGRFVEKKGLTNGLRACIAARSRGVDLRVTVIGDAGGDSAGLSIKRELLELAQTPSLSGRVEFTGFLPVQKTRELVRTHDVLLCPSQHAANGDAEGGSPVVLTEAMAVGLICVGSRHCDIPEVIVHEQTGLLCNEGDYPGMGEFISRLAENPAGAKALAKRGRAHIERFFNLGLQMDLLGDTYRSLCSLPACGNPGGERTSVS